MFRVGHGFDIHAFSELAKPLILGGIQVDAYKGVQSHSDGDVVLHALTDALLGALSLGDIGQHFPDSDKRYQNLASCYFLKEALGWLSHYEYQISNIDITIIAQTPKISPFIALMRSSLASLLQCSIAAINIKATTTERLGSIGQKQGLAVHSIISIHHRKINFMTNKG